MTNSGSTELRPRTRGSEYPFVAELLPPARRVAMPRLPRLHVPGCTFHVVGRCNDRKFCFTECEDFKMLLGHLGEMARTYEVTIYAYTFMANHIHLLLQTPRNDSLGRPLRWFFRETTRAWQRRRVHCGHFWERRYWACLVDDDAYGLAALRYLDRNPVRAGLVEQPSTYPWSSCSAYALGTPNPLITFHPSYLGLSPYAAVRRRHYRAFLAPSVDPRADARDSRWTSERLIGSLAFMQRFQPRKRKRIRAPD